MHTDTVYITSQQYDSIYIYNYKTLDRTKDTVYIQHEDEVAISADAERPLSWFDRLARAVFWIFVIGGAAVWLWMSTRRIQS